MRGPDVAVTGLDVIVTGLDVTVRGSHHLMRILKETMDNLFRHSSHSDTIAFVVDVDQAFFAQILMQLNQLWTA